MTITITWAAVSLVLGILLILLGLFGVYVFLWGCAFDMAARGQGLWGNLKDSFPRILIIPALIGLGILLLL